MSCPTYEKRKEYARKSRLRLIVALGGKCVHCGTTERLEFDHINPDSRTWDLRRAGMFYSMTLYWRDYRAGLLQLLCRHCNAVKSDCRYKPEWENDVALVRAWFKKHFGTEETA